MVAVSGTFSSTVGAIRAPVRVPPAKSRAPASTASFTQRSTRLASPSLIIGPMSVASSSLLPIRYSPVRSTNRSRNGS